MRNSKITGPLSRLPARLALRLAAAGAISVATILAAGAAPAGAATANADAGTTGGQETFIPAQQPVPVTHEPGSATGLPVPRFVSLKSDHANLRRGPGTDYPVDWVFVRRRIPLEIIAETSRWRKVRDADGDVGWIWHSMLDGRRTALFRKEKDDAPTPILDEPKPDAAIVAYADSKVLASLKSCKGAWCLIEAQGYEGYVQRTRLWGVYPDENFD